MQSKSESDVALCKITTDWSPVTASQRIKIQLMQGSWKDASGFKILEQFLRETEEHINERMHQDIRNIHDSVPRENDGAQDGCTLFSQNTRTCFSPHVPSAAILAFKNEERTE